MTCPYCCEEIDAKAIVCKHCSRDLLFFVPLYNRICYLESELAEIKSQINIINPNIQKPEITLAVKHNSPVLICVLSIVLGSVISILSYYLYRHEYFEPVFIILSISSPIPAGILLGYQLRIFRLKLFLLSGFLIGLLNCAGTQIVFGKLVTNTRDLFEILLAYVIGGVLLYMSGGILGNWLSRKISGNKKESYSAQIAKSIIYDRSSGEINSTFANKKIEKLKKNIETFAPILTFVASILTAVLTYLAKK